ncbi:MAG: hypothetical protein ACTSXD_13475 [Candidatus Heimdallarchaeaceae archaeon]
MNEKVIKLDDSYEKVYKIRKAVPGKSIENYVITVPKLVLEREAKKYNLTLEEFIKNFRAKCHFNSFKGVYVEFKHKDEVEK